MAQSSLPKSKIAGGTDFKFSEGWLQKWKSCYDVHFKKLQGESKANSDAAAKWLAEDLPKLLNLYKPCHIYNTDETGIFWHGLPDHTHVAGSAAAPGGKVAEERGTVLVMCNVDGSDKLPLLMIGKSKKPRGFP